MRKFLTALILIPLAVILVAFAVANRHLVTVSFDPFDSSDPNGGVTMPLFAVLIATAIFGTIAGGIATWIGQHRWRRAARHHEADARRARAELADFRAEVATARNAAPRSAPSPPGPGYAATGRDKQGVTL